MKHTRLFLSIPKNVIGTKECTKNGDDFLYFSASIPFHIAKGTKVSRVLDNIMKTKMLISSFEYSFILLYINLATQISVINS